jgi:membrane-associated phospholipid phosphatase
MTDDNNTQLSNTKSRPPWLARSIIIAFGLGLWFYTQSLIGSRPLGSEDNAAGTPISRGDRLFAVTQPINALLHSHPYYADLLLIASSAVIDVTGIWLIAVSVCGATMRPFVGLLLVFALRQLTQALCVLPAPEGIIWRNPGLPSLLVTYHVANDFFFSGHTAIAVFGAMQLARLKRPRFLALGVAVALFEITTVIILRAHYTMDVFTGAIAALWAAHAANCLGPRLDRAIAKCGTIRKNSKMANAVDPSTGTQRVPR